MQSILTALDFSRFIPSDFEDYRAGGADLRRELTHAVMHDLKVPERWHINGEYGSEFGGLFPVQCRFSPAHERFYLALCSPGDINPGWLMVFVDGNGTPAAVLRTEAVFLPDVFSHVVSLVASLDAQGYSHHNIISMLALEGGI